MGPSYLLLGAVAAAVGHLPEGTVSGTGGPTSPLERWLWELKLPLANISTNLVGSKVNVADTVCTHFEIVGLSSKFEAPEKIIVHADSLGLKCFGDYNVHTPIIGKSKGVVEFAVHGELNLMLDVTKNFSTRPIIEIKPECSVKLSIDSLDFHGSGISWLIEFLAPALRLFLPLFLDGQLCNVADGIITTNLTEVLETIDEELVLPPSPPPPYIENLPPNALDIQHNPTIGPLLETINRLARDNLTQLLSGAPEHFAIDANLVVAPLTVLPGLDLSLYIHRVNVTGINTGRISSILEPNHKYYLNSGVGFDTLDITVDITLFVGNKTIDGELPFLEERSLISLSTRNVELGASVLTAINLLSLPEVNLFQLLQPECWQRLAYDFNISYVNVSMEVDSLSTKVNGTLESEMFQFLNGLVAVLLHTDAPYIPGAIDRAANLLLLPLLRSLLMPSSSAKCHLYPNQSTIDWEQVGLLGATEMINEKTLNTILRFAAPSGTFASNFSVSEQFSLLGIDIGLSLGNVMINGLNDTFYDTVLAKADSPSAVVTKLGIGQNSELQIRADLGMSLNSVPPIRTTLNETIWRGHMSLMETLVVSEGFLNLTIDSIIDPMHRGGPGQAAECFIADYVEKLNFTPFDFELGSMSTLLLWKGEWVSVKDVLYDLSPTLLSVLEELIKILPGDIESNINSGIQTALKDATYYCKGLQPPVENADTKKKFPDWAIALTVVGSTWLLMMIVGCWTWRRCKQKKLEKQKEPLIESKYSRPLFGRTASDMPDCALSEYYPMKSSFGVFIQLLIPSLILGGMAIKIWALIVWVTRVKLQVDMGDKEVLDTFIIDFTFQNMVEYFWKSEAYLISSLIVLGSSVVPLAMSLTMLACWFVPMNPSYRGRALLFFAQCGKGSYIDVMFLCYIILVIKQDISFHGITGVITAVPVQGIFGGIASTTCNLFTCIWMWHLHNNQMEAKTHPTETHRTEKRYNLWQLHTRRIGEEEAHSWRNSCKLVSVVILFLFAAVSLVTITFKSEVTWVWAPEGWLSAFADPEDRIGYKTDEKTCGFIDYAGSAVVHMTGGIIGLIGAIFVGPRIGKFENPDAFKGHNYALIAIGVLILWFGWFGFNCGSTLAFDGNVASKVAVTTVLSPASACITGIVIQRAMGKYWDVANALNTVLAGLVSITAGCSVVADWHAIFIGMIGAMVYMSVSKTMIYFRVDDPVDAIAVHGGCGIWGTLAVGIFAEANEIKNAYDCPNAEGNGTGLQFGIQLAGILAIIGFVGACSIVMFLFIKLTIGLRVGAEEEELGLDESEHGHKAYSQGAFNQDRDTEKGKEIGKHGSNVELKQTSTVNLTKAAV